MIGLEDRQTLVQHIEAAQSAGARLRPACEVAGISVRTFERWQANDGLVVGDRRPKALRPVPAHALTEAERARILAVANAPRFADLEAARAWGHDFVRWYNLEHRHSSIRYVTPAQRHAGEDVAILAARHQTYLQARERNPARWSGNTRDWSATGAVTLNPVRDAVVRDHRQAENKTRSAA